MLAVRVACLPKSGKLANPFPPLLSRQLLIGFHGVNVSKTYSFLVSPQPLLHLLCWHVFPSLHPCILRMPAGLVTAGSCLGGARPESCSNLECCQGRSLVLKASPAPVPVTWRRPILPCSHPCDLVAKKKKEKKNPRWQSHAQLHVTQLCRRFCV